MSIVSVPNVAYPTSSIGTLGLAAAYAAALAAGAVGDIVELGSLGQATNAMQVNFTPQVGGIQDTAILLVSSDNFVSDVAIGRVMAAGDLSAQVPLIQQYVRVWRTQLTPGETGAASCSVTVVAGGNSPGTEFWKTTGNAGVSEPGIAGTLDNTAWSLQQNAQNRVSFSDSGGVDVSSANQTSINVVADGALQLASVNGDVAMEAPAGTASVTGDQVSVHNDGGIGTTGTVSIDSSGNITVDSGETLILSASPGINPSRVRIIAFPGVAGDGTVEIDGGKGGVSFTSPIRWIPSIIGNHAVNGSISQAAVDVSSIFVLQQTTPGITFSISSPSLGTDAAGQFGIVINGGSVAFTFLGKTVNPNQYVLLFWTGSAWTSPAS